MQLTHEQRDIVNQYLSEYPRPEGVFFRIRRHKAFGRYAIKSLGLFDFRSACYDGLINAVIGYTKSDKTSKFSSYAIRGMKWDVLRQIDNQKKTIPHVVRKRGYGSLLKVIRPMRQFPMWNGIWNPDANNDMTVSTLLHDCVEDLLNALRDNTKYRQENTSQKILRMNYDFYGRHYTLEEIGKTIGCSPERVRQLKMTALRKFAYSESNEMKKAMRRAYSFWFGKEESECTFPVFPIN